jgi:hypothetical protein
MFCRSHQQTPKLVVRSHNSNPAFKLGLVST